MKRRIFSAVVVFILSFPLCAVAACQMHCVLSHEPLTWKIPELLTLVQLEKVRLFTLLFAGVVFLLILAAFAGSQNVKYKNSTVKLTPEIAIPESAGNGEYGTARFMTKREIRKAFALCSLNEIRRKEKELKRNGHAKKET